MEVEPISTPTRFLPSPMSFPQGAVGHANRVAIQTVASLVSERQKTGYAIRCHPRQLALNTPFEPGSPFVVRLCTSVLRALTGFARPTQVGQKPRQQGRSDFDAWKMGHCR